MSCFNHNDRSAVGICKACHKGICIECSTDVGGGLACKNECERKVKKLNSMIELNIDKGSRILNLNSPVSGVIFYLAAGLVFLYWGIEESINFSIALGSLLIAYGIYWSFRAYIVSTK
jgi:hypothetical protein